MDASFAPRVVGCQKIDFDVTTTRACTYAAAAGGTPATCRESLFVNGKAACKEAAAVSGAADLAACAGVTGAALAGRTACEAKLTAATTDGATRACAYTPAALSLACATTM
jgi:hypothetical protein